MGTDNFINFYSYDGKLANQLREIKSLMDFHVDLCKINHSGMLLYINLFQKICYECVSYMLICKFYNCDELCDILNCRNLWSSLYSKLYVEDFNNYC